MKASNDPQNPSPATNQINPLPLLPMRKGRSAFFHVIPQIDGCSKHHQVHDEVEQNGELRENLVKTLNRGHYDKKQA